MAEAAQSLKDLTDQYAETVADSASDNKLIAHCSDFLRHYNAASNSRERDVLDKIRIDLGTRLHEYDMRHARAYNAIDMLRPSQALFALVCQKSGMQRPALIEAMKTHSNKHLIKLVAAGNVSLSAPDEERFVLVYERPVGKKLSDLLANTKEPLNEQFICKNIIAPLASVIAQFAELTISHGYIHPDNIYFGEFVMLGDCISEPCGYSQPFYFEPIERMQAQNSAKGEGDTSHDYYAIAVLVAYMLWGQQHFADSTQPELIASILRNGPYEALTKNKEVPEAFTEFFRGMLSPNSQERWSDRSLKQWLEGRRQNALLPGQGSAASRPFEFGNVHASSRRELAHQLFLDWAHIPSILASGQLLQWVTVSLRSKELADQVVRITKAVGELSGQNQTQLPEQLMRLIQVIDPQGPIRILPLSFHVDGLNSLVAELTATKAEKELQLLARFVEFNMVNFWLDIQRKGRDYTIPPAVNSMLVKIERLRICIRNPGLGFGMERMLYELNPDMPCQSSLCAGQSVATLPGLLQRLDQVAGNSKDQDPVDRHVAAFIGTKLALQHEIKLHELQSMPVLAAQRSLVTLKLLAMAQQRCDGLVLPGLTHWITLKILPQLDHIRSRSLRQQVKATLVQYAASGNLVPIAELVLNSGYAPLDGHGFQQACQLYITNDRQIASYRSGELVEHKSSYLGGTISKMLAYLTLIATLVSLAHHV